VSELPLLVGYAGMGELLGVHRQALVAWRSRTGYDMPVRPGLEPLPVEDLLYGDRPLWYTEHLVRWAVRNGLLAAYPGRIPAPVPVCHFPEVAAMFGVSEKAVRGTWRANTLRAREGVAVPPAKTLPEPDLIPEGLALWFPVTLERWAREVGRRVSDAGRRAS